MIGLDVIDSPHADVVGSIAERACVGRRVQGVDAVLHSATLHKPHVGTHTRARSSSGDPGLGRKSYHEVATGVYTVR